ncbi:MAG: helix-turn-helix domain-containing protein [Clostridium sp.]|nr:helix-turn-helix domain-containing protein [Clostridium sp.]
MEKYTLHIKNMVCRRCVMTVEDICRDLGIGGAKVSLGSVEFEEKPADQTLSLLYDRLEDVGFEPLESGELVLLEKVKALVRTYARSSRDRSLKLSAYIGESTGEDFWAVSRLFSSLEGRTIQRYLMLQRIEYVKELLLDDRQTLAEIADETGFSSVAHLSSTFKKVTGVTLSDFRLRGGSRTPLDQV